MSEALATAGFSVLVSEQTKGASTNAFPQPAEVHTRVRGTTHEVVVRREIDMTSCPRVAYEILGGGE